MESWLKQLASPAQKALAELGVASIADVSKRTRFEIENLHGIGKNALLAIEAEIRTQGLEFADEGDSLEVSAYIDTFDHAVRGRLLEIRNLVRKLAPKAREKMGYGMPTYYYKENLVHYAGFKAHIGLYPTPHGITSFEAELQAFSRSKGGIQFPLDKPLPLDLIEKIVRLRLKKVQEGS